MDYFEALVRKILEKEGYWVLQSYKVLLTKEEKASLGKPTMPRVEIDLVAYKASINQILLVEVKSFLDSGGVDLEEIRRCSKKPEGRFKLFTCEDYREIVISRTKLQLVKQGLVHPSTTVSVALAAGKARKNQHESLVEYMKVRGWPFFSPEFIKGALESFKGFGYENDPFHIATKVLNR